MKPPDPNQHVVSAARRAVAYVRRSTDRQEQSLDDQRRAIARYAAQQGFEIVRWYEDDAISGGRGERATTAGIRVPPRHIVTSRPSLL